MEVSGVGSYFDLTPAWPSFYIEVNNQLWLMDLRILQILQMLDSAVQEVRRASRAATFLLIIIYLSNLSL